MVTHSRQLSIFAGESHGQRSLVICSPWGHKESDMTEETKHNRTNILNRSFTPWKTEYRGAAMEPKRDSKRLTHL